MKAHKDNLNQSLANFPRSWTDPNTGTSYPRKWLEDATLAVQKALGWYDVIDNAPAINTATQRLIAVSPLVFTGTAIEQNYTIYDIPQAELDARANQLEYDRLAELDRLSIRDIRAWVASQPTAPQSLKDREALAVAARSKTV